MAQLVPHPPYSNFCSPSPLFYSILSKVFQTVPSTLIQITALLSESDTTFLMHTHRLIFRRLNAKPWKNQIGKSAFSWFIWFNAFIPWKENLPRENSLFSLKKKRAGGGRGGGEESNIYKIYIINILIYIIIYIIHA